jgi:hypothetical protein
MSTDARQQLSELVAGFSQSLTQLKVDVPPAIVGRWVQFVNDLHGLSLDRMVQEADATMKVMAAMKQATQSGSPSVPEKPSSPAPTSQSTKSTETIILEAGPYSRDRAPLLRDLNLLVKYADLSGHEVSITSLPITDIIRVVNGGLAVMMQLLDRIYVPPIHTKFVSEARHEIEKTVVAVARMVEAKETDPLVTVEIRGGLAKCLQKTDPAEPPDERPSEDESSPEPAEPTAGQLAPSPKKEKKKRNWSPEQRQAAADRMRARMTKPKVASVA